jgi:hypothetical protein
MTISGNALKKMNEILMGAEQAMVIGIEQRKGSFCEYDAKFCQEGYCPGCEIYLKKSSGAKAQNPRAPMKLQGLASK